MTNEPTFLCNFYFFSFFCTHSNGKNETETSAGEGGAESAGEDSSSSSSMSSKIQESFDLIKNISFQWILGIFLFGVLLIALCLGICYCKKKHQALDDQYHQRELVESAAASAVNVNGSADGPIASRPASGFGLPPLEGTTISRDGLSTGHSTRSSHLASSAQSWETHWPSRPGTGMGMAGGAGGETRH